MAQPVRAEESRHYETFELSEVPDRSRREHCQPLGPARARRQVYRLCASIGV